MDLIAPTWLNVVAPASAIVGGALAYGAFLPRAQLFGTVLHHAPIEHARNPVALTLAGPLDSPFLPTLMDILDRRDVDAAVHVTTPDARKHPRPLRDLHAAGHLITNAGPRFSLSNLVQGYGFWRHALDAGDDAITDAIGQRPLLFAPPHGCKSPVMLREALWGGQAAVTWSRASLRWLPASLDRRRLAHVAPGTIVQFPTHRRQSLERLPALLDAWAERGLCPQRLDHLLRVPGYRTASH